MFKVIEPQNHNAHLSLIEPFLGLLKIYQNFYLDPEAQDRATCVIAKDDKRGVYGGAILYPRKIPSFLEFLSERTDNELLDKMVSSFQPKIKEYWTARICLCLGYDRSTSLCETVELYRCFYHRLYKAFCYFGEKENLEYLSFTLRASDTHVDNNLHLLTYQTWPSLLEAQQSDNGFHTYLHGILSFKEGALKENTLKTSISKANTFKRGSLKSGRYRQKVNLYPACQTNSNSPTKNFSSNEWRIL